MTDVQLLALTLLSPFDCEPAGACIRVRRGHEVRYVMAVSVIDADDAVAYVAALFGDAR